MQHGYFDDFRAVRDQEGKIFSSPARLLDPQVSEPFPQTEVTDAAHVAKKELSISTNFCFLYADGTARWICGCAASQS